jgi:hypothetical protein
VEERIGKLAQARSDCPIFSGGRCGLALYGRQRAMESRTFGLSGDSVCEAPGLDVLVGIVQGVALVCAEPNPSGDQGTKEIAWGKP